MGYTLGPAGDICIKKNKNVDWSAISEYVNIRAFAILLLQIYPTLLKSSTSFNNVVHATDANFELRRDVRRPHARLVKADDKAVSFVLRFATLIHRRVCTNKKHIAG